MRIRVVNADEDADRATFAEFIDGTTRWRMDFGAAGGDLIVLLQTGVVSGNDVGHEIQLSGGGSGYHLYELIYDPIAMTADLFVDGTELFSDFAGMPTNLTHVAFGAGQAARTGHGHYNLVQFDAEISVSEPATLATFGFSLAALGWMGRRRKAA